MTMPDLDARFRGLDRLSAPDLWPDIERREPRPAPGRPAAPRWLVAAVAILLAAAGIAVAVRAFVTDRAPRRPAQPVPGPAAPVKPVVDVTVPIRWPSSIVYGEGSIWVAASANDGTGGGTIYRLDPDTAEVLAEIPSPVVPGWETGGGAMEVANGDLWVAGGGSSRNLVRIDPAINRVVQEISVEGASLGDVAIDEHGVWVSVFVREGDPPRERMDLVLLDPGTGNELARIPLESEYGREVIAIDGAIWVHERETHGSVVGASVMTRVDPETERVLTSVPVGSPAGSVTEGGGFIWATTWTSEEGNQLVRLDPRTNELTKIPSENLEFVIAVGEGGVWGVARRGQDLFGERGGIVRFDPVTNGVDAGVSLKGGTIAIAVAPGAVWVVHYEEGVTRVELRPA
jgi:streptogramin lyase